VTVFGTGPSSKIVESFGVGEGRRARGGGEPWGIKKDGGKMRRWDAREEKEKKQGERGSRHQPLGGGPLATCGDLS